MMTLYEINFSFGNLRTTNALANSVDIRTSSGVDTILPVGQLLAISNDYQKGRRLLNRFHGFSIVKMNPLKTRLY